MTKRCSFVLGRQQYDFIFIKYSGSDLERNFEINTGMLHNKRVD
jgi:hypothetical protein